MGLMFYVRSARALGPQALSRAILVHASCRAATTHPRPSRLPARTSSPRIACPPFDSAARVGLQPAAELRHLQRHDHGLHVQRALRACPWPPSPEPGLFPVLHAACRAATTPQALPPPGSHLSFPASHALPSTRQYASAFNQPLSFDTSSVTNMWNMFWVRSARALGPQPFESRGPCMPTLPPRTLSPASRHAPRPPLYTRPPFDSGRAQTPCPPPTSCSSAARGRAPRPSPPLAMARAGLREAARERSSARELLRLIVLASRTTTTSILDLDSLVAAGKRDCLCCL